MVLKSSAISYKTILFHFDHQVQNKNLKKMKIAGIVSGLVAAGRQARDAQSLFDKMIGDQNDNVQQRNFLFQETVNVFQMFMFYMGGTGKGFKSLSPLSPKRPSDNDFEPTKRPRSLKS